MTHDPLCDHDDLCPMKHEQFPKHPLENCWQCDLIAKVRKDERERAGIEQTVPSYEYPFSTAVTVEVDINRYMWTSHGPWLDEDGPWVLYADVEAAIAAARAEMADGQSVILASECEKRIAEARRDMLAKCIDWMLDPHHHPSKEAAAWAYAYAGYLRELQEQP